MTSDLDVYVASNKSKEEAYKEMTNVLIEVMKILVSIEGSINALSNLIPMIMANQSEDDDKPITASGTLNVPVISNILLDCGMFKSPGSWSAIFSDSRISRFKDRLPTSGSRRQIVEETISIMSIDSVISLLHILLDRMPDDDLCKSKINKLIGEMT